LPYKIGLMLRLLRLLSILAPQFFRSRSNLLPKNIALRQQLAVLKQGHRQPRFGASDRFFWVMLWRFWNGWKQSLILVRPETVVRWHHARVASSLEHLLSELRRNPGRSVFATSLASAGQRLHSATKTLRNSLPPETPSQNCAYAQDFWPDLYPDGILARHNRLGT
jgi:hypothetical protein